MGVNTFLKLYKCYEIGQRITYVANKYGYVKTESFQLSIKIWSMVCNWEAILKKEEKCKASTYWTDNPQINWKERGSEDAKQTLAHHVTKQDCKYEIKRERFSTIVEETISTNLHDFLDADIDFEYIYFGFDKESETDSDSNSDVIFFII